MKWHNTGGFEPFISRVRIPSVPSPDIICHIVLGLCFLTDVSGSKLQCVATERTDALRNLRSRKDRTVQYILVAQWIEHTATNRGVVRSNRTEGIFYGIRING